jgi:prolyl oligopeptidase
MKYKVLTLVILVSMGCIRQQTFHYPETPRGDVVDNYYGTEVPDPYRWLEDDMSEETAAWVKAQNDVTFSYLESIPFRDVLRKHMTEIWNYPKMETPQKTGDLYFYSFNTGLQNQSIKYIKRGPEGEAEVFLDPNELSEEGTAALTEFSVSDDRKYVAYGISSAGSDWIEFFVRDTETRKDLDDHLKWIKSSNAAWLGDGFFYARYDEPREGDDLKGENLNSKIYYHRTGTPQEDDILIYSDDLHPERSFGLDVTDDDKYMILYAIESTSGNAFAFKNAGLDNEPFTWIEKGFENDYNILGNKGNILYVLTNLDAPRCKIVAIDLENPNRENWLDIVPEHEKDVLESATLAGGRIICAYLKDASHTVKIFDLEGVYLHDLLLPGIGSLVGISHKNYFSGRLDDNTLFYSYSSFNFPSTVYRYNVAENISEVFYAPEADFDTEAYVTRQVFFSSKDGTRIPMFIVHKKGIKLNSKNPTLLYGYGGFNITYSPSFSSARAVWLEQGGIFALANIRGGGEYGEEWHKAGTMLQKQNVFDDFIAAAEYLIREHYTSSKRLAIYGGSNGGLLIGAVINQRPELFSVAVPMVGVMDMLRFQKFTIGRYWTVDYGSSDDPEQFRYLLGYSPLHNISGDIDYPAVLVTTGDHDDRVVPAHSFKYIATLQEKYKGPHPVMIRISTDAGHGAGKPTDKVIAEYSDIWSFIFYNMDFTPEF